MQMCSFDFDLTFNDDIKNSQHKRNLQSGMLTQFQVASVIRM